MKVPARKKVLGNLKTGKEKKIVSGGSSVRKPVSSVAGSESANLTRVNQVRNK